METKKKLFVPLFITFVMVVGAFAVMVPAPGTPTAVGGREPNPISRSTGDGPISVLDAFMEEQETLQPELATNAVEETIPIFSEGDEIVQPTESPAGIEVVTEINPVQGTRSPGVNAGGPYGGPDTYEGTWLTFTATVDDPSLIFFRWDLDNDGEWDTKWELSLTMSHSITWFYDDDYFDDIVVEAWDGVSTKTVVYTGSVLGESTSYYWYIYPASQGVKFTAKKAITINQLGFYNTGYWFSYRYMRLWDAETRALIRQCIAPMGYYRWNWCSISPITLTEGKDYVVSIFKGYDYYPYIRGPQWNTVTTDTDFYKVKNMMYLWRWQGTGYPQYDGGSVAYPMTDFKYSFVEILPLAESDTAFLEVNNVAPAPFNVQTDPPVAYEGSGTSFMAQFNDPGLGDDWWYRWDFGDGETSDWFKVNKMLGGARVLHIHAWMVSYMSPLINDAIEKCGTFCIQWDTWDYGPVGYNAVPPYDLMRQYDVILTGSDYFVYEKAKILGDRLADFMDEGGNVVAMTFAFTTPNGGVEGRFIDDEYAPVKQGYIDFAWIDLGTIYVPGHPVFNGVSTLRSYFRSNTPDLTTDAIRVADWTNDNTAIAEKTNPVVDNGAISFYINLCPYAGYTGGEVGQAIANAVMYASRADPPVPKTMPIWTDPVSHVYADDHPVTTSPSDDVTVRVEVKDDDHLMLKGGYEMLLDEDFAGYNYPSWPSGWSPSPSPSWRTGYSGYLGKNAANQYYYYNYGPSTSILNAPSLDLAVKPYIEATFHFKHTWYTFGSCCRDGYVEVSDDGGLTWTVLADFHWYDPYYEDEKEYEFDVVWLAGSSDARIRFRLESSYRYAYYMWAVTDIWFEAAWGTPKWGLGEASGIVTIVNVEPTAHAGPTSGQLIESGVFDFFGYKITDPALWEPTEWFAYQWDFDDGEGTDWIYKGSLAPPKLDILVMHSFYIDTGAKNAFNAILSPLDLVGTIEYWDFLTTLTAPSVSYMLQFDILIWLTWYGYFGLPAWNVVRRTIGDNMADYVDANRGGVLTMMCTYCTQMGVWDLLGRYIDDDYGPFEKGYYVWGSAQLGEVHYPDHQIMNDKYVITEVGTTGYDGDLSTTDGAIRVASWNTGGAFAGAKEHPNGARTVHYGGAAHTGTGQISGLWRNMLAYVYGAFIPTDDIYPLSHQYGDNGVYYVDITLIDDDMGWTWDLDNNMPVADPMYAQTESHYIIPISVDNVDPMINTQTIEVYIPAEFCLRVSGTEWHMVSMSVLKDATFVDEVVLQREAGDPNDQALCTMVKVDLKGSHTYSYILDYIPFADMSGSNPAWVVISPWRDPITPGHGRVTYNHDFQTGDPSTWTQSNDLTTLREDLMDSGHGAEIAFEATAFDYGTDDLAFIWIWGDQTPYGMHIHHNNGMPVSEGTNTNPESVGFSELWFDFAANDWRSPHGTTDFLTRDIAYHMFEQGYYYYVTLIVMDDDVNDPYPSPYGHPGIDMEFIDLDLR